ncbi:MAG: hypothetical protein ACLQQ0_03545, partial [Limisphaerales bacterium]
RFRSLPLIINISIYGRCSTPATPQWGHFKRVHRGTLLKSRDSEGKSLAVNGRLEETPAMIPHHELPGSPVVGR